MYTSLFLCSSIDGHLCGFHTLSAMNSAAVNICIQIFIQIPVFNMLVIYTGEDLLGHMVILCLTFWETIKLFYSVCIILHSYWQSRSVLFLHTLTNAYFPFFYKIMSIRLGVKWNLIVVLICISLMTKYAEQVLVAHLHTIFEEIPIHIFCLFFHWVGGLFVIAF